MKLWYRFSAGASTSLPGACSPPINDTSGAVNIRLLETARLPNLDLNGAARLTVQTCRSVFTGITTSAIS